MLSRRIRLASFALALSSGGVAPASALCVLGVQAWDTLRMRAGPSPQAREVGAIPADACGVAVAGACRGAWCPVVWRGRPGWSNAAYLSAGPPFATIRPPPYGAPPAVAGHSPERPRQSAPVRREAPAQAAASPPAPVEVARAPVRDAEAAQVVAGPRPAVRTPAAAPPQAQSAPASPAVTSAPETPRTTIAAAAAPAVAPPTAAAAEMCVTNVVAGDTLKVRAGPGLDQSLRYGYPAGACGIKLTGACQDGWCPVDYRGYRGWAEQKFLK